MKLLPFQPPPQFALPFLKVYYRTYFEVSTFWSLSSQRLSISSEQETWWGQQVRKNAGVEPEGSFEEGKVGQAKLSVFWDSWTEQSPSSLLVPWLLSAHLASSCSFVLPLLQDSSQPADGTRRFWIGKLTWYSLSNYALHHRGLVATSLYKDKSTLFLGLDDLHDKNDMATLENIQM